MNEPVSAYVLTNQNSPAFWLIDNLWMPLAGSFLTDGNFCFIEQVCGVGIGGPPTHAHPSDEGLYILEGHCTFNVEARQSRRGLERLSQSHAWLNTASLSMCRTQDF